VIHQRFLVDIVADQPVKGLALLHATVGVKPFPAEVKTITYGDEESAPDMWEDALREYAEKRGWKIVEEVVPCS
jgi:hypothetical protein